MNIQVNRQLFDYYPSPITIDKTNKILEQMKNSVCKIKTKIGEGTGFFCYIPLQNKKFPVLITSNHIVDQNIIKENKILSVSLNDGKEYTNIELFGNKSIYTNKNYDITIIEIFPSIDKIDNFIALEENLFLNNNTNNINPLNETIYIIHYPKLENRRNISVSFGLLNQTNNNERKIICNIGADSFGSPILKLSNNKIIGIYRQGDNFNFSKNTILKTAINEYLNNLNLLKINNNLISQNIHSQNKIPEINTTVLGPEAGEGEQYMKERKNEIVNQGPEIRQTMVGPESEENKIIMPNKNNNFLQMPMQMNQVINNNQSGINNTNRDNIILINNIQINTNKNIINKNIDNPKINNNNNINNNINNINNINNTNNMLNSQSETKEKTYKNRTNNEDFADNLNINAEINNKNNFSSITKNNNNNNIKNNFPRSNSSWGINNINNNMLQNKHFNTNNINFYNNLNKNFKEINMNMNLNQSYDNLNINNMINNMNTNQMLSMNNMNFKTENNMNLSGGVENNQNLNNNSINNEMNTSNPNYNRKSNISLYNFNFPNLIKNNMNGNYSFSRYTRATRTSLKNSGNTSHINSVFQFLGSFREFADFFLNPNNQNYINNSKKFRFSYLIERLFIHLYPYPENEGEIYLPKSQLEFINELNLKNNPNIVIRVMLNILHNELNNLNNYNANLLLNPIISDKKNVIECGITNFKKSNDSIISNIFNFFEIKESQCSFCNYKTYEFLNLFTLELDILECYNHFKQNLKVITICDCLEYKRFLKQENLFCNKCGNFKLKLSSSEIFDTPKIFIFSLDRDNMSDQNLLNVPFCVEEQINLGNFVEKMNSYKQYELIAIVSIYMDQKKYTTCCKSPIDQQWYYYDDGIVNKVDFSIVIKNHNNRQFIPCILAYKAINFN